MEVNWITVSLVVVVAIVLVIFLIKRNAKDKKELEDFLHKNDSLMKEEEAQNRDL